MRIALLGGGVIARLVLESVRDGAIPNAEVIAIAGRSGASRAGALARDFGVPFVAGSHALIGARPEVVVEAASHDAVREHVEALLASGIAVIVLSCGALADDELRARLERAAATGGALLYVPSGGIGGLDALKAACAAGVDEATITVAKPPAAWKGIASVEESGIDLDRLKAPVTLFEGPVRDGAPRFPANVNIAAGLALAGIGFDRTRLKVVADPGLERNTHSIHIAGRSGTIDLRFENVPMPTNAKTALLACCSAIAALRQFGSPVRYGT